MDRKKPKIKVLYTIPNFDTAGSGKALLNIAKRLSPNVFEPHIACFNRKGEFFKTVEKSGIPIHIIRYTSPMNCRIKGLLHSVKIAFYFRKNRFDIIHSFHYGSDYSEALAAKLAGTKWVYTKKNMSWGGGSSRAWRLRTKLATAIAYQNSDMKKDFFLNESKLFFIPRGVSTEEYRVQKRDEGLLKEFNIKEHEKVILCVANLDAPVKGIEVLIDAFALLANTNEITKLVIVGYDEEPYADNLKERAIDNGCDHKVIFTGKRFDIKLFLSIADVFVLPTLHKGEGSPVSLLEAMISGVIVLGSDVPGIRDQLKDFNNLMFEAGNVNSLVEKLLWVLNLGKETSDIIKAKLIRNVHDNYSIGREVKDHEKMYLSMMKFT